MTSSDKATTVDDLSAALRQRYPSDAYFLLFEVRNATGFGGRTRFADALALGLWPSRGLELEGFEMKVSRSDWLRELRKPNKAEEIYRYCDRWWVVAPSGIVQKEELPPHWGLLTLGKTLRCAFQAPRLKPQPLDRSFLASVLREVHRQLSMESIIEKEVAKRVDARLKALSDLNKKRTNTSRAETNSIYEKLAAFTRMSGVQLNAWSDEGEFAKVGAVLRAIRTPDVKAYLLNELTRTATNIDHHARGVARQQELLRDALKALSDVQEHDD